MIVLVGLIIVLVGLVIVRRQSSDKVLAVRYNLVLCLEEQEITYSYRYDSAKAPETYSVSASRALSREKSLPELWSPKHTPFLPHVPCPGKKAYPNFAVGNLCPRREKHLLIL